MQWVRIRMLRYIGYWLKHLLNQKLHYTIQASNDFKSRNTLLKLCIILSNKTVVFWLQDQYIYNKMFKISATYAAKLKWSVLKCMFSRSVWDIDTAWKMYLALEQAKKCRPSNFLCTLEWIGNDICFPSKACFW